MAPAILVAVLDYSTLWLFQAFPAFNEITLEQNYGKELRRIW